MFRKAQQLHFVGVGGSGMSGIAEVLVNPATERLTALGAGDVWKVGQELIRSDAGSGTRAQPRRSA